MLDVTLKETRIARELKEEGRVEREAEILAATVPVLLRTGMTVEQIAKQLQVEVKAVRRAAQEG